MLFRSCTPYGVFGIKVDKGLLRKNFNTAQTEMTRALRYGRPLYSYAYGKIPLISNTP